MTCAQGRLDFGPYLLGALDVADSREFAQHLSGCAGCRAEVAALRGVTSMLDEVPLKDIVDEVRLAALTRRSGDPAPADHERPIEQPSPGLLDRLLARAAEERDGGRHPEAPDRAAPSTRTWRRHRLATMAAGAAAAAVAAAVVVGVSGGTGSQPRSTFATRDAVSGVVVSARLTPEPTGTGVSMTFAGATPGQQCWLVAIGRHGQQQVISGWLVNYRGAATISGTTSIRRQDLTGLRVVRQDDVRLADLAVS